MLTDKARELRAKQEQLEQEIKESNLPNAVLKKRELPQDLLPMEKKEDFEYRPEVPYNQKITSYDWNTNIVNIEDLDYREKDLLAKWQDTNNEISLINESLENLYENVKWNKFTLNKLDNTTWGYKFSDDPENAQKLNDFLSPNYDTVQLFIPQLEVTWRKGKIIYSNVIFKPKIVERSEIPDTFKSLTLWDGFPDLTAIGGKINAGRLAFYSHNPKDASAIQNTTFSISEGDIGDFWYAPINILDGTVFLRKTDPINYSKPARFLDSLCLQEKYHSGYSSTWGRSEEKENDLIKKFLNLEFGEWETIGLTDKNSESLEIKIVFENKGDYNAYFNFNFNDEEASHFKIRVNIDKDVLKNSSAKPSQFFDTLFKKSIKKLEIDKDFSSNKDIITIYQAMVFSLFTNTKYSDMNGRVVRLKFWSYDLNLKLNNKEEPTEFVPIKIDNGVIGKEGQLRLLFNFLFKNKLSSKLEFKVNNFYDLGAEVNNVLVSKDGFDKDYAYEILERKQENIVNNIHNVGIFVKFTISTEGYDDYVFSGIVPPYTVDEDVIYGNNPIGTSRANHCSVFFKCDKVEENAENYTYEFLAGGDKVEFVKSSGSGTGHIGFTFKSILPATENIPFTVKISAKRRDDIKPLIVYCYILKPEVDLYI